MEEPAPNRVIIRVLMARGEAFLDDDGVDLEVCQSVADEIVQKLPSELIATTPSHADLIKEMCLLRSQLREEIHQCQQVKVAYNRAREEIEKFESSHEGQDFADHNMDGDDVARTPKLIKRGPEVIELSDFERNPEVIAAENLIVQPSAGDVTVPIEILQDAYCAIVQGDKFEESAKIEILNRLQATIDKES